MGRREIEVEACVDSFIDAIAEKTYDTLKDNKAVDMRLLADQLREAEQRIKARLLTFQGRLNSQSFGRN